MIKLYALAFVIAVVLAIRSARKYGQNEKEEELEKKYKKDLPAIEARIGVVISEIAKLESGPPEDAEKNRAKLEQLSEELRALEKYRDKIKQ